MKLLDAIQKGKSLQNSAQVKNIQMIVNAVGVTMITIAHFGLLPVSEGQVQGISGTIQDAIGAVLPYILGIVNTYATVATSDKVGT